MFHKNVRIQLFFIYMCINQILSEHACGENPLRRFTSLSRILNDIYPGRDINQAMVLLRDSNPELHRRLQPIVSLLNSEWRLYTDCVTMVDNGYFKRSDPYMPSENRNKLEMEARRLTTTDIASIGDVFSSKRSRSNSRLIDILNPALTMKELLPLQDNSSELLS